MNALLRESLDEAIERFGWAAIGVMPTFEEPCMPFTYTVGLYNFDKHPELIVVGLHPEQAHGMLWGLYERVRKGERFEAGQRDSHVIQNHDVIFQAMPPSGAPLHQAREYFEVDELPALQVVWPDTNGRFPFEEDFEQEFVGRQVIREEDL